MKIAVVCQPFDSVSLVDPNSIGVAALGLARALGHQHEVIVIAPQRNGLEGVVPIGPIRVIYLPVPIDPIAGLASSPDPTPAADALPAFIQDSFGAEFFDRAAWTIAQFHPDLVHIENFLNFAERLRKGGCDAAIVTLMQCQWLSGLPESFVRRKTESITKIAFVSEYLRDEFLLFYPDLRHKTAVVYNGVDTDRFCPSPRRNRRTDGSVRALFVGRVSPEKGVHLLLEACGRLDTTHQQLSLQIVGPLAALERSFLIGAWTRSGAWPVPQHMFDTKAYSDHLDDLLKTARAEVEVTSFVPHRLLPKLYQQADFLVFPSVWPEPFGLPLAEASATGIPVVAVEGGAVSEIVVDGETGFVVEQDVRALAEAIERMARDHERRSELGNNARKLMESSFTWHHAADQLIAEIEPALV